MKKPKTQQSKVKRLKNLPRKVWAKTLVAIVLVVAIGSFAIAHDSSPAKTPSAAKGVTNTKKVSGDQKSDQASSGVKTQPTPAPSTSTNATQKVAATPATKGKAGSCGPAVARIAGGYIYCDLDIPDSHIPAQVRLLAPTGAPNIKYTCSNGAVCTNSRDGGFTAVDYPDAVTFDVTAAGHAEIAIPINRTEETLSAFGALRPDGFTDTSSYWVYGPVEGSDCCSYKYTYDIYNGYIQTKQ